MHYLKVDNKNCVGCRTCQLACSYHHKKIFDPSLASLTIRGDDSEVNLSVILFEDMTREERQKRVPCDLCKGETLPFCVKYCPVQAITVQEAGRAFS